MYWLVFITAYLQEIFDVNSKDHLNILKGENILSSRNATIYLKLYHGFILLHRLHISCLLKW